MFLRQSRQVEEKKFSTGHHLEDKPHKNMDSRMKTTQNHGHPDKSHTRLWKPRQNSHKIMDAQTKATKDNGSPDKSHTK